MQAMPIIRLLFMQWQLLVWADCGCEEQHFNRSGVQQILVTIVIIMIIWTVLLIDKLHRDSRNAIKHL